MCMPELFPGAQYHMNMCSINIVNEENLLLQSGNVDNLLPCIEKKKKKICWLGLQVQIDFVDKSTTVLKY